MNIVRKFTWGEDRDIGIEGWIPMGMPHLSAAASPMLIAHDTLEHFGTPTGEAVDEFLAFGAMLYLRAESDYWANIDARGSTDPVTNMALDAFYFCRDLQGKAEPGCLGVPAPRATRPLHQDAESIIQGIVASALEEQEDERGYHGHAEIVQCIHNIAGWMRIGYRKAAKRWNLEPTQRFSLFWQVEEACRALTSFACGSYGDTLHVSVSIKHLTVDITHIYDGDAQDY